MNQVVFDEIDILAGPFHPFQIHFRNDHRWRLFFSMEQGHPAEGIFLILGQVGGSQLGQARHILPDVGLFTLADVVDHVAQLVKGGQEDVGNLRVGRHLARADHIEDRLCFMGKLLDLAQPKEAAPPLDGMRRPKDLVDKFLVNIGPRFFDCQQVGFHAGKMFSRFSDEFFDKVVLHCHGRLLRTQRLLTQSRFSSRILWSR